MVGYGAPGINEAVSRVLRLGDVDGTRLPLEGGMGQGEWKKWTGVIEDLDSPEKELGLARSSID